MWLYVPEISGLFLARQALQEVDCLRGCGYPSGSCRVDLLYGTAVKALGIEVRGKGVELAECVIVREVQLDDRLPGYCCFRWGGPVEMIGSEIYWEACFPGHQLVVKLSCDAQELVNTFFPGRGGKEPFLSGGINHR